MLGIVVKAVALFICAAAYYLLDPFFGLIAAIAAVWIGIFKLGLPLSLSSWSRKESLTSAFLVLWAFVCVSVVWALQIKDPLQPTLWRELITLTTTGPVAEELLYRQAAFATLLKFRLRPAVAIAISSVLFGAFHLIGLYFLPQDYWPFIYLQTLNAVFVGSILGMRRADTGSLAPPIILHSIYNAAYTVGAFLITYWLR